MIHMKRTKSSKQIRVTAVSPSLAEDQRAFPLFLESVQAGFPSPADDYIDQQLDLNDHLIEHPAATFFVRVEGRSMMDAGILSGDILVVDRARQPRHNTIVIAAVDGELTVKRLQKKGKALFLVPENKEFEPIKITPETAIDIWGVVTYVIHCVK